MGSTKWEVCNCEVSRVKVRNIRWVGIPTTNYEAMLAFLRDTMGLRLNFQETTTAEFSAWEGDAIQVMAPGDPYFEFFTREASGRFRSSRLMTYIGRRPS
jgi:catechol 2,3-dioxygenase-like lactoylglutathione lyase family enzyme